MPRKVLITKDTLEEILAKYQGGGSGGGSGKLYQLAFSYAFTYQSNIVKCIGDNSDKDFNIDVILFYTENDFKCFCEHCNNQTQYDDSVLSFPTNVNEFVTFFNNYINGNNDFAIKIGLLTDLCVFSTKIYRDALNPLARLDIEVNVGSKDVLFGVSTNLTKVVCNYYFDKTKISIDDTTYTGSVDTPVLSVSDNMIYDVGNQTYDDVVLTNSCTLTEYGTSASGGTVEAEPIISIKMTNVDAKQFDEDEEKLRDAQFYCTKERWDNFVALASSQYQIDITYQNFDSMFKQLDLTGQTFALGYLLMDYNDGKILPTSYLANKDTGLAGSSIYYFYKSCMTMKNIATGNIEVVLSATFDNDEAFPNGADRNNVPYTTTNTVITVEEIAGPAIGASGGSAELPKYYMVSIYVSSQNSGSNEQMLFHITESNLDILIDEANQQLSSSGYTLTKDNWSTLIPQLATASNQLRHALIRGLLILSNNASAEDIDGYSNMIYVDAIGVIKLGHDVGNYTEIVSSSITPITNQF